MIVTNDAIQNEIVEMLKTNEGLITLIAQGETPVVIAHLVQFSQEDKLTSTEINRRYDIAEEIIGYLNRFGLHLEAIAWNPKTRMLEMVIEPNVIWFGALTAHANAGNLDTALERVGQTIIDLINRHYNPVVKPGFIEWLMHFNIFKVEGKGWQYIGDVNGLAFVDATPLKAAADYYVTKNGMDWELSAFTEFCEDHQLNPDHVIQPVVYVRDQHLCGTPDLVYGMPLDAFKVVVESIGLKVEQIDNPPRLRVVK